MANSREDLPDFVSLLLQARELMRAGNKPLPAYFVLFLSLDSLLREILSVLECPISLRSSLNKLRNEVARLSVLPATLTDALPALVTTRNLVVHGNLRENPGGSQLLNDYQLVSRMASWYLTEFAAGPRLSSSQVREILGYDPVKNRRRVFVCYAQEDIQQARHVYMTLKQSGHTPWMDKEDLLPGKHWEPEIKKAIRSSDFFIALMSSRSVNKRGFVQTEIRFALDVLGEISQGEIFFIPVRLDDCVVPEPISLIQWVDVFEGSGTVEAYEKLLLALAGAPQIE